MDKDRVLESNYKRVIREARRDKKRFEHSLKERGHLKAQGRRSRANKLALVTLQ